MKSDYWLMFVLCMVLCIQFVLLMPGVDAGRLWATAVNSAQGTTFTLFWAQGCSNATHGSWGPNTCHTTKPTFCPVGSQGGNEFIQRCGIISGGVNVNACGCNTHNRCNYDLGNCVQCLNPCTTAANTCTGSETCSAVGDWCNGNVACTCGCSGCDCPCDPSYPCPPPPPPPPSCPTCYSCGCSPNPSPSPSNPNLNICVCGWVEMCHLADCSSVSGVCPGDPSCSACCFEPSNCDLCMV